MSTATGEPTAAVPPAPPDRAERSVELTIGGMTCASCAVRIEKKLNKLEGVAATVNFATGKARVSAPDTVTPGDLVSVVEQAGYTAALPDPGPAESAVESDQANSLRQRLVICGVLTLPV